MLEDLKDVHWGLGNLRNECLDVHMPKPHARTCDMQTALGVTM